MGFQICYHEIFIFLDLMSYLHFYLHLTQPSQTCYDTSLFGVYSVLTIAIMERERLITVFMPSTVPVEESGDVVTLGRSSSFKMRHILVGIFSPSTE